MDLEGAGQKLIVALDDLSTDDMGRLLQLLWGRVAGLKIHLTPQVVWGPLIHSNMPVCADQKLMGPPTAVGQIAKDFKQAGFDSLTVMARAGLEVLRAAAINGLKILAVTRLSSEKIRPSQDRKFRGWCDLARFVRAHGIIAPPGHISFFRTSYPSWWRSLAGLEKIAVGVRPLETDSDDHWFPQTPAFAIRNGADRIIVGRSITKAFNPSVALEDILREIADVKEEPARP